MKRMNLPVRVSLDDVLILLFLAVTASHLAHYLARFETEELKPISWVMAAAIDMAVARTSFYFRVYKGQKQKMWSLISLIFFSSCSCTFNINYYRSQGADLFSSLALALVFPAGVTLLSILRALRTVSEQAKEERQARKKSKERVKQAQASRPPLSDEQQHIIRLYRDDPGTSLATLASSLGVSKTTASRKVQTLINLEYLKRDGREVRIVERGDGSHG